MFFIPKQIAAADGWTLDINMKQIYGIPDSPEKG